MTWAIIGVIYVVGMIHALCMGCIERHLKRIADYLERQEAAKEGGE